METAQVAKALDGDSLYQERARAALPILVRQAHSRAKIFYGQLAAELGMSNTRTLNYPLGSIGTAIQLLSKEWGEEIPAIQYLVVNQATGLPGEGVGWFVRDVGEFKSLPLRQRKAMSGRSSHQFVGRAGISAIRRSVLRHQTCLGGVHGSLAARTVAARY